MKAKRCFKPLPTKCTAIVKVAFVDDVNERVMPKGVGMNQIPINMNDSTTGHKPQGMSKDKLIMVSWSFIANWMYVILSRVRTLSGLFLLKSLSSDCLDTFQVPHELQVFERHMNDLESAIFNARETNVTALASEEDEGNDMMT